MKKMIIGIVIVAIILISGFAFWLNTEAGKEGADDSNLALLKDLKTINMDKISKHLKAETDLPDGRVDAQAEAYNGYAYHLAAELFKTGENNVYSPTSLYFALGVVYDGASDGAKERIGELLGLGEETLDYYNTLYTSSVYKNNEGHALYNNLVVAYNGKKDYSIKQDFIDNMDRYYRGMVDSSN